MDLLSFTQGHIQKFEAKSKNLIFVACTDWRTGAQPGSSIFILFFPTLEDRVTQLLRHLARKCRPPRFFGAAAFGMSWFGTSGLQKTTEIEGVFGYTTLTFPYFWGHQNFKKHTYQEAKSHGWQGGPGGPVTVERLAGTLPLGISCQWRPSHHWLEKLPCLKELMLLMFNQRHVSVGGHNPFPKDQMFRKKANDLWTASMDETLNSHTADLPERPALREFCHGLAFRTLRMPTWNEFSHQLCTNYAILEGFPYSTTFLRGDVDQGCCSSIESILFGDLPPLWF